MTHSRPLRWLAGALLGLAVAMPSLSVQAEPTLDAIKARGKLLAGIRADAPPVGYVDANGKLAGFAVDLAKAVADDLGVGVEYVAVTGQTRIPLIQNGGIDAEFGTTTPTKKREEVVDFSIIYNWDAGVPLFRAKETTRIEDYVAPRKVATTQNNILADIFKKKVPGAQIIYFQEYGDAVSALLAKQVDSVLLTNVSAHTFAKRYPGKLAVGEPIFVDPQAIIVRQNDSLWRNTLNWTLQRLWANGTYGRIYEANFGYKPSFQLWSPNGLQPGIVE